MEELPRAGRVSVDRLLADERRAFLAVLSELSPDDWNSSTECPAWTVKGIALHVLGDDLSLLSRQRDAVTPGTTLFAARHPGLGFRQILDGFNEQWVEASGYLSPSLVIELLRLTGDWTSMFYSAV